MPMKIMFIRIMSIKVPGRGLIKNVLHLGSGDLLGRLSSMAVVILLGHRYGVVILGVYALAQGLTQYLQPLIDFGLRHVGARLLAKYPQAACDIIGRVQRRRLRMAAMVLPLILIYAAGAKLPAEMKVFLFAFAAVGTLYAISLDWAAWGRERLYLVGFARSAVPFCLLISLLIARTHGERVLAWAVGGNALGFLLQGAIFWAWWRNQPSQPLSRETVNAIRESLDWRRTSIMGLAWLSNLAFNTIDVLMLGLMSNPEQVGLYSASYRVLNQVLSGYYLITQVLYPRFARQASEERREMLGTRILLPLAASGAAIAIVISLSRRMVLAVVFGRAFVAASPLLFLLAWSVPLDFVTSYLSNAYIAWGMEKKILVCTGIGAFSNIVLNLAFIPGYGARGAAVNTLLSYAIFLAALGYVGKTAKEITGGNEIAMGAVAGA
jgi:O-antigen/teichoic acid export membrane protein